MIVIKYVRFLNDRDIELDSKTPVPKWLQIKTAILNQSHS